MRNSLDVITELREEAATDRFAIVALAIGFESTTAFIFSTDPNPVEKLNAFVRQGGEPVGFLGLTRGQKEMTVEARSLKEFERQQWVDEYLTILSASFGAQVKAARLGRVLGDKH